MCDSMLCEWHCRCMEMYFLLDKLLQFYIEIWIWIDFFSNGLAESNIILYQNSFSLQDIPSFGIILWCFFANIEYHRNKSNDIINEAWNIWNHHIWNDFFWFIFRRKKSNPIPVDSLHVSFHYTKSLENRRHRTIIVIRTNAHFEWFVMFQKTQFFIFTFFLSMAKFSSLKDGQLYE